MPFKSKAQQRFMFAAEDRGEVPEGTAERWAHHTKNIKKLPEHKGHPGRHKKSDDDHVAVVARLAAEGPLVEKLASDTRLSHPEVYQLAAMVDMPVVDFVKQAYADVDDFIDFLRVVGGHAPEKKARMGSMLEGLLNAMKGGGKAAWGGIKRVGEGIAERSGQASEAIGKTPGRRAAAAGAAAAGLGTAGFLGGRALTNRGGGMQAGAGPDGAPGPNEQALNQTVPQAAAMQGNLGDAAGQAGMAGQQAGQQMGVGQQAGQQGGGMSPALKALLLGGGAAGIGGLGYMMGRRRNRQQEKESADETAKAVMRRAIVKKAARLYREKSAQLLCAHLDRVAQALPLEKSAAVRTVQREVASGKPLAVAIKVAYPHLSGEKRGILATHLVRSVLACQKRANEMAGPASVMSPSGASLGQQTQQQPPQQAQQALGASPGLTPGVPQVERSVFQGTPQDGLSFMRQGV